MDILFLFFISFCLFKFCSIRISVLITFLYLYTFRYWLLTVLRSGETVPPKIELKLARLYRTAFSRQQQRHLGLLQTNLLSQKLAGQKPLTRSKVLKLIKRIFNQFYCDSLYIKFYKHLMNILSARDF